MKPTEAEIDRLARRPYGVIFEYGEEADEGVLASIVEWRDCFAAGGTRLEAVRELEHALRAMITFSLEEGRPIPEPAHRYAGKILLRLARTMHRDADERAKREGVSLNQWLGNAVARELGGSRARPPERRARPRRRASPADIAKAMDTDKS